MMTGGISDVPLIEANGEDGRRGIANSAAACLPETCQWMLKPVCKHLHHLRDFTYSMKILNNVENVFWREIMTHEM